MQRRLAIGCGLMVALAAGASGGQGRAPNPCEPKKQVLAAVKGAVGPVSGPNYEVSMRRDGNTCSVDVWSIPKKPGGFVTVIVDAKGKVVRVIKGE